VFSVYAPQLPVCCTPRKLKRLVVGPAGVPPPGVAPEVVGAAVGADVTGADIAVSHMQSTNPVVDWLEPSAAHVNVSFTATTRPPGAGPVTPLYA
jgi:hypothetical protein